MKRTSWKMILSTWSLPSSRHVTIQKHLTTPTITTITAALTQRLNFHGWSCSETSHSSSSTTTTTTANGGGVASTTIKDVEPPVNVEKGIHDRQVSFAKSIHKPNEKKNLVILGSGWGGFRLLKEIDMDKYNVYLR